MKSVRMEYSGYVARMGELRNANSLAWKTYRKESLLVDGIMRHLGHHAANRKVADSRPDEMNGFFSVYLFPHVEAG
jgi:hypothetical protein